MSHRCTRWYRIDRMENAGSEAVLRAVFHALPGVERADVSFADRAAVVLVSVSTTEEVIIGAVTAAGFGLQRIG